jgi:simple sugar transport system ATP-binding protein
MDSVPVLEAEGLTKSYGDLFACRDVSFSVHRGEVMGLLGQNGAGKSTVMGIVGGVVPPNEGRVLVQGMPLSTGNPIKSAEAGIGIVHQHYSLVPKLTVWENVILGDRGRVNRDDAVQRVREISQRYGLDIDPLAVTETLTAGEKQRVEIIKCLRRDPQVLMLDEPTSVLTLQESRRLFEVLKALVKDEGRAVVLVSHRLAEIMHATDHVLVMRSGLPVFHAETSTTSASQLAEQMLGREMNVDKDAAALGATSAAAAAIDETSVRVSQAVDSTRLAGEEMLRMSEVTVVGDGGRRLLDAFSLVARSGEIVGIAGVEGNGQTVVVDVLSGLAESTSGSVEILGRPIPSDHRGAPDGIGIIPSDRHDAGCVLSMSVAENLVLGRLDSVSRFGVLNSGEMKSQAERLVSEYNVLTATVDSPMWSLSGGNQQKLILAREMSRSPEILVAAHPTRGLDVGAMEFLWAQLRDAAARGCAVVLISTELDEILALSDRVVVMQKGRVVGEMQRDDVDLDRLGMMMGGEAA